MLITSLCQCKTLVQPLWFTAVFVSVFLSGVHIVQMMCSCEWDETGEVKGYWQYGYDGEDFIIFDLKTETWVAPVHEADNTKKKWDHDWALTGQKKNYLTQICPESLKKYVTYGRSSLMRTGTFQMSVDLDVSSVKPEDWHRYRCVFQLSGVNEDIVTRLDKSEIKTNERNNLAIIIAIFAVVLVLGAVNGIIVYKKKTSRCFLQPRK
ncbi:zinc-alpha-2-glycoprotein-like [Pundamilia nyererei]|uniref:Zinc-alpha-2-glycoprotein-like n=1 Tax=Pundamilia nyererei TaxID=303518 RepID=A0A9Y6J5B7_9CICH|nr:PREDICTED: zinc-alpha-2-glycoprotein-like [Pundamilia nyererei]